jgi:hypothetical protein
VASIMPAHIHHSRICAPHFILYPRKLTSLQRHSICALKITD